MTTKPEKPSILTFIRQRIVESRFSKLQISLKNFSFIRFSIRPCERITRWLILRAQSTRQEENKGIKIDKKKTIGAFRENYHFFEIVYLLVQIHSSYYTYVLPVSSNRKVFIAPQNFSARFITKGLDKWMIYNVKTFRKTG